MKAGWCIAVAILTSLLGVTTVAVGEQKSSCTIYVESGEPIQEAIDQAPEGAVICLAPGIWRENLLITKNVSLRASILGTATIWGNTQEPNTPVVRICAGEGVAPHQHAPYVVIENIVIAGSYGWSFGILVGIGAKARITNCVVAACGSGVCIEDAADAVLNGCVIIGNRLIPDPNFIGDGVGIWLWGSAMAVIQECTILQNGNDGIKASDNSKVTIVDCTIDGNRFGIALHDAVEAVIEQNQIIRNYHYSIYLSEPPCYGGYQTDPHPRTFTGHIVGRANIIPGPDEPGGNCWWEPSIGACSSGFCPPDVDLAFLTSKEGGELDRRK